MIAMSVRKRPRKPTKDDEEYIQLVVEDLKEVWGDEEGPRRLAEMLAYDERIANSFRWWLQEVGKRNDRELAKGRARARKQR